MMSIDFALEYTFIIFKIALYNTTVKKKLFKVINAIFNGIYYSLNLFLYNYPHAYWRSLKQSYLAIKSLNYR